MTSLTQIEAGVQSPAIPNCKYIYGPSGNAGEYAALLPTRTRGVGMLAVTAMYRLPARWIGKSSIWARYLARTISPWPRKTLASIKQPVSASK